MCRGIHGKISVRLDEEVKVMDDWMIELNGR